MTFEPSDPIAPTLTTTRVGSGRSARLMALVVAGVLIGVVGYAFVNRTAPPPPPPAVALAPASATPEPQPPPRPTPSPARNQLKGDDGIFGWPVVAQLPLRPSPPPVDNVSRDYRYAVLMDITGGTLRAALEQEHATAYAGSVVIESADAPDVLVIEVGRVWSENRLTIFERFGSWPVELTALGEARRGQTLLLVEHVAPGATGVPGPIVNGYTFAVLGRRVGSRIELYVEIVWPATPRAGAQRSERRPQPTR